MTETASELRKDELPRAVTTDGRWLRYGVRVPLLLWHIVIHLPLTLVLVSPLGERVSFAGEHLRHRAVRWWSHGLMRIFGFRVVRVGDPHAGSALLVANHLSWLDIELIHSQRAVEFVAKAEIARWPLVAQMMVERLRAGAQVGVFPEGGTTDGSRVRVFHARIFQTAVEAGVPVQPVALRYLRDGQPNPAVPFLDGENFFVNFVRLLGEPSMVAEVHFLEPLTPNGDGRRRLAESARNRIQSALGHIE
jgi:1-acyl-sn-glycerol-3-phosphate acyltransferase